MRKRVDGLTLEELYSKEVWILLRITKPRCCLTCRNFLNKECTAYSRVQEYILKQFKSRTELGLFDIGSECKHWR